MPYGGSPCITKRHCRRKRAYSLLENVCKGFSRAVIENVSRRVASARIIARTLLCAALLSHSQLRAEDGEYSDLSCVFERAFRICDIFTTTIYYEIRRYPNTLLSIACRSRVILQKVDFYYAMNTPRRPRAWNVGESSYRSSIFALAL